MGTQKSQVDLDHLTDVVWEDLSDVQRSAGSLLWVQNDFSPWWRRLDYGSETEARSASNIGREEDIRDYRVLVSETPNFNISFVQGPFEIRKRLQAFYESLEFVLKKELWKGRLPEIIHGAWTSFDRSEITQEKIDYFCSPRFSLKRYMYRGSSDIYLKSERFFGNLDGRDGIHEIPEAEKLIRVLVRFSNNDDIIFDGGVIRYSDGINIFNGGVIGDKKVRAQLNNFRLNLEAAYGIATAERGSGILVSPYLMRDLIMEANPHY